MPPSETSARDQARGDPDFRTRIGADAEFQRDMSVYSPREAGSTLIARRGRLERGDLNGPRRARPFCPVACARVPIWLRRFVAAIASVEHEGQIVWFAGDPSFLGLHAPHRRIA